MTAEERNVFTMMILRSKETHHCLVWVPFDTTYGLQRGYPKRATQASLPRDRSSVVARVANDQVTLRGGQLMALIRLYFWIPITTNVLLITVMKSLSFTTWMPYTPHKPIPAGAVVTGKDSLTGITMW